MRTFSRLGFRVFVESAVAYRRSSHTNFLLDSQEAHQQASHYENTVAIRALWPRGDSKVTRGACRYVGKLREELEDSSYHFFGSSNERERIKSVLADLSKTSSDFAHITARALEQLSTAIVPRLRCVYRPCRPPSDLPFHLSSLLQVCAAPCVPPSHPPSHLRSLPPVIHLHLSLSRILTFTPCCMLLPYAAAHPYAPHL